MIIWQTPIGNLGTIKELEYFSVQLEAYDNQSESVEFTHIAGTMPPGTQIVKDGLIKGIPVNTVETKGKTVPYTFTIRCNTPSGVVADRTFTMSVTNFSSLGIYPASIRIATFDNHKISQLFSGVSENPGVKLTWTLGEGESPLDARTGKPIFIDENGLYEGWTSRFLTEFSGQEGFSVEPVEAFPYDFEPTSGDKIYSFEIQVTDGINVASCPVVVKLMSASHLSCDSDWSITIADPDVVWTCDLSSAYSPIVSTDPSDIPVLPVGTKFAYKFSAVDPLGETIYWKANAGITSTGLSISAVSGWISGTIAPQDEETKTTSFLVWPYKPNFPYVDINGTGTVVNLTTVKDPTNYITWDSPTNLGTITNGSASELVVKGTHVGGNPVSYEVVSGLLPHGTELSSEDGLIKGRASFQFFSLDGQFSNITVANTYGITSGMFVEGPGVASGSMVTAVIDDNTLTIEPALYILEGIEVTFSDISLTNVVTTTITDQSTTTRIDGGTTTFDRVYTVGIRAYTTVGNTVSATKDFNITVDSYNKAPYLNVYVKAMLPLDQRQTFTSIMNNVEYFPPELIYRSSDKWFGKTDSVKSLFLPGLAPNTAEEFALSIEKNHYVKSLKFGEIKTARAVDDNGYTRYEVVYVELLDDRQVNGVSAALSIEPSVTEPYRYGDQTYTTIYPNSYQNMQYRLETGIGYTNRGALPSWMVDPQEDGSVLGMTRCLVLAYTVPGGSKLIRYRLQSAGINFNNIFFQTDRYNIDFGMLSNYDLNNNQFYSNTTIINASISGNVLTVSNVYVRSNVEITGNAIVEGGTGNIKLGQFVSGPDVDSGTQITEFITGSGGEGTYYINRSATIEQEFMVVTQKDAYLNPNDGDKYIAFPQTGVYK